MADHRSEIDRTASILNAVRGINRGVVNGEDFSTLITSAFQTLIDTGILSTAWLYLYGNDSQKSRHVAVGWDKSMEHMIAQMRDGWIPGCCNQARKQNTTVSTSRVSDICDGCPLRCSWMTRSDHQEETLTSAIRTDNTLSGFISVKVAPSEASREERLLWLKELISDIPFALQNIDLIEKRNQAERALHKEALRRQILMGGSRDGIAIFNQDHEIVEANQRFAEMLGYTMEEVLRLRTWDFEAISTEAEIRKGFASLEQISVTFETRHRRKDGSLYDAEVSASGAMVGDEPMIFAVSRDITEKKAFQATLFQSDRLASMGLISAGVAHEINNPLAYMLCNLESLSNDLSHMEWANGDVGSRITEALSGARRIQRIANTLGTFSRANHERVAPVNVAYALECALNMAFNEIKYRARLITNYSTTPNVLADEGSLSQVFLNLLINAAHAIPEGNPEENEIRVCTAVVENEVQVEISDTGSGVPKEYAAQIFEPFFTTRRTGVGSGLGLAISKNIISAFGGDIRMKDSAEYSSVFVVSLPVAKGDPVPASETPPPGAPGKSAARGRILVVDDEEGICRALTRMFRRHEVVAARSGNDAMQMIHANADFDVILCDMMMPGISGMDVHVWLGKHWPHLAERLIFITGGAFTPQTNMYLKSIDTLCIEKPFESAELIKIVSDRISRLRD